MDTVKRTQVDDREASALQPEYPQPMFWYVTSFSTLQVFFRSTGTSFLLLFSNVDDLSKKRFNRSDISSFMQLGVRKSESSEL
jgi:hypothetical protein